MKNQNSTQKPFIITIASTKGGSAKSGVVDKNVGIFSKIAAIRQNCWF